MSTKDAGRGGVPWLSKDEERAWRALRRLMTKLPARIGRDLAADSGLSNPDYEVLSTLSESPGTRQQLNALAEKMEWSQSRLSHHTNRMQTRGLIDKASSREDARGCVLSLTPTGWAVLRGAAPAHVASVRHRLLDHLTAAELRTLGRIAARIAELEE